MTVPDEAVEAAARGMFAEEQCDRRQKLDVESNWMGRLDDHDRDEYRGLARAALTAAAPFIAAQAWDEGRDVGIDECAGDAPGAANPYRSKDA